jgi:hypothetical protein
MTAPVAGIVRLTTPRSVVPTPHTQGPSLLPLLIPVSIAAAALMGKLFSRKKTPESDVLVEMRVEMLALVLRCSEK